MKHIRVYNLRQAVDALILSYDETGNHGLTRLVMKANAVIAYMPSSKCLAYAGSLQDLITSLSATGSYAKTYSQMKQRPGMYADDLADEPFVLVPFEDTTRKVRVGLHVNSDVPYNRKAVQSYQNA